ncbi:MAG: SBBP repeat-containing protein, partial [Bacteroidia bacterium]
MLLLGIKAFAQYPISPYVVPNVDWIKYNNPSSSVVSSPMAIDINSNVYSTGYSGLTTSSNLLVFKYDSLGAMTYSYSYNNGNYDLGKAIKVDAAGNAYVAGVSYATTTLNDFYIIKLSPTGSVLWAKRLDNAHKDDEPYDIALDATGNAYVTGKTYNTSGSFDIWTVALKYNSGATLWSYIYNGAANLYDSGSGIVLSSNSSTVYVTGNTNDTHGSNIITFALKASTGATVSGWPVITDGTANSNDYSNGIIRSGGNIVICGETNNTSTGVDYTTIKYNGLTGSIIWQKQYDFSSATNRATGLARDSADHIGVVGTAMNGSTCEIHTILYDSLGNQLQVNKESTGLTSLAADPKICNDTIAHHWYVVGSVSNVSQDILIYQVTPTGTTSWKKTIDGQNYDYDLGTSIGVNGVGVVYVGAHSKNSSAQYDYTTIKLNQSPVYFPPDLTIEKPRVEHLFYENKGQIIRNDSVKVAKNILFNSEMYPYTFYGIDRFSYKFFNHASALGGNDTTQRIDVVMHKANTMATAYPYIPDQGTVSHMEDWLPNMVTGIQGYQRYFIPNIYPSIDLHYYSNQNGLKMYYVLKPQANPASIQWDISGATTTTINGTNLEIKGLNGKVVFDQPTVYTTNTLGIAVALTTTATWQHIAGDSYSIALSAYSPTMPIIIELDYGNASVSTSTISDNRSLLTYYGGFNNDGIKSMDTDKSNGNFVFLSALKNDPVGSPTTWPIICCGFGLSVSSTTNTQTEFFGIVVMDKDGRRLTANTYGIYGYAMNPLKVVLNNNYVTVIGNNTTPHPSLPTPARANMPYTPTSTTSYTTTQGDGYVVQFSGNLLNPSPYFVLNNISWATRLNGNASDLDRTPDGKNLYITTATDNYNFTPNLKTETGAYNSSTFVGGGKNFQISKFDTVGGRKWATIYQCPNTIAKDTLFYNTLNNNSTTTLESDQYIKCKISCDKYGFSIAGQTNGSGLKIYSKYGAPLQSTIGGS